MSSRPPSFPSSASGPRVPPSDSARRSRAFPSAAAHPLVALLLAVPIFSPAPVSAAEAEGPLTERSVVESALAHNPGLAASIADLRRADLLVRAEEHRYSFVFAADGSATQTRSPSLGLTGVSVPESTTYVAGVELRRHLVLGTDLTLRLEGSSQLSRSLYVDPSTTPPISTLFRTGPGYGTSVKLTLTQPLLRNAGSNVYYSELQSAQANRESAHAQRDQTASQLLLDVLTAYWELVYAEHNVAIQVRSIELARAQRDETASKVQTGSTARVDQLSFDTRIATLQEDYATALATEKRQAAELARLVGAPGMAMREPDPDLALPPADPPSADVRERALSVSFELEQQRAAVKLAEVQARTAEEPYRSKLDLNAYLQAQGLDTSVGPAIDQLSRFGAVSAHVALNYEAPLDGTQQRSERERSLTAIAAARARLTALEQRIAADVDKALTQEDAARARIDLADKTLANAREQLDAETLRFRTGSSTAIAVREAEEDVRSADLRGWRARADWVEARLTLEHLSGRLLERWSREPPTPAPH